MIPRMMFSIKVWLKFFAADRVKRKSSKKQDRRAEIDHVQHNFSNRQRRRDERDNATTILLWGELEAADFADQRIALPIAYEISCRAWP
jgi:hypothetical protein